MTRLQGSWIWYELMTPDVEGARAFYEAVVGWTITPGGPETGGYGFIANADGGMTGGVFALSDEICQQGARPGWLGYIGVDDVDASLIAVQQAGGRVRMPAQDVPMAGRIAMVADCCGAPFYIMTPTPPPGGGESTAFSRYETLGRCSWNELMAGDADRAIAFYTGLFGWGLPDSMDMGEYGTYQFIEHDGVPIGAIMPMMPQVPATAWNHYFRVASIEAAKAAVEAGGGQVINGPMQVPGDDWIIQGMDPQGAMFSLVGGK
ncbi:MAG: VOC family protein [Novosphingobium sp.]